MATDNTQIAQVKGSFTNFLLNNPSFQSAFLNQYSTSDNWKTADSLPLSGNNVNDYCFLYPQGDIYQWLQVGLLYKWVYICNYFDSHSSRIVTFIVNFSDINTGVSPSASFTFNLPELQINETVTDVFINVLEQFSDSASNDDCVLADIYDTTNATSLFTATLLRNLEDLPLTPPLNVGQVSSHKDAVLLYAGGLLVNFPATFRVIAAIFTATDLTLLNGGSLQLSFKIETINPAS